MPTLQAGKKSMNLQRSSKETRRERKKEDTLFMGEMSGRFHHILVDSKEFKMEKEAFG